MIAGEPAARFHLVDLKNQKRDGLVIGVGRELPSLAGCLHNVPDSRNGTVRRFSRRRAGRPFRLVECRLAQDRPCELGMLAEVAIVWAETLDVLIEKSRLACRRLQGPLCDTLMVLIKEQIEQ